jgi:hypothetical protein
MSGSEASNTAWRVYRAITWRKLSCGELDAFERFVAEYREARGYAGRMIGDRLVPAVHVSGNTVV